MQAGSRIFAIIEILRKSRVFLCEAASIRRIKTVCDIEKKIHTGFTIKIKMFNLNEYSKIIFYSYWMSKNKIVYLRSIMNHDHDSFMILNDEKSTNSNIEFKKVHENVVLIFHIDV